MNEFAIALAVFAALSLASLVALVVHEKLPQAYRHDETNNVVRLIAGIFVVMTSLVLGLMVNSAKNAFESIDRDIHAIATDIIVLERTLRDFGPEADETRTRLLAYTQEALKVLSRDEDVPEGGSKQSEQLLHEVGRSLRAMRPTDQDQTVLWQDARQQFQKLVEMRWTLIEEAGETIPTPLLVMLVAWLVLIFASFGYRAPKNLVVVGSLLLSAGLVASSIYLILDMELPFTGPIQVSPEPLQRVVADMER